MSCPSCDTPLVEEDHGGTLIDRCARCGGLWFDASELRSYLDRGGRRRRDECPESRLVAIDGDERRACPRCTVPTLRRASVDGIEVWRCDGCRGLSIESAQVRLIVARRERAGDSLKDAAADLTAQGVFEAAIEIGSNTLDVGGAVIEFLAFALSP